MSNFTRQISRLTSRQAIAILMVVVISVLLVPAPTAAAALRSAADSVRDTKSQLWEWLIAGSGSLLFGTSQEDRQRKGVRPSPPLSRAEQEAKVARIELNVSGEVAAALATFRTPQPELSRLPKFNTSRLSCSV